MNIQCAMKDCSVWHMQGIINHVTLENLDLPYIPEYNSFFYVKAQRNIRVIIACHAEYNNDKFDERKSEGNGGHKNLSFYIYLYAI